MINPQFLPAGWSAAMIAKKIGLVSDTHFPLRCEALPPALFTLLQGVDLILHAGDVGELRVLDELSTMAPVIAVHGNDDSEEAQRELPYQQLIHLGGQRILLWHSHYPTRDEEMASRVDDALPPKIVRSVERAQRAGATVVVFGHWHIPLTYQQDGVLVVNPGALASGGFTDRQYAKTMAFLFLSHTGQVAVTHVNLTPPHAAPPHAAPPHAAPPHAAQHNIAPSHAGQPQPFTPAIDWQGGFKRALAQFSRSILAPDLEAVLPRLRTGLSDPARQAIIPLILPWAQRCWRGEQAVITLAHFRRGLLDEPALAQHVKDEVAALLG